MGSLGVPASPSLFPFSLPGIDPIVKGECYMVVLVGGKDGVRIGWRYFSDHFRGCVYSVYLVAVIIFEGLFFLSKLFLYF